MCHVFMFEVVKMIDKMEVRLEKGKAIIELGISEALELVNLALENGFIKGSGMAAAISGSGSEDKEGSPEELKELIPTAESIISYIQSKQNFLHNTCALHRHFFGRELGNKDGDKFAYDATYRMLLKAHDKMANENGGRWVTDWIEVHGNKCRQYKFIQAEKGLGSLKNEKYNPLGAFFESTESLIEIENRLSEPSLDEVRAYISKKEPIYEHSMPELTEYFFGRRLYAKGKEYKSFYRLYRKARDVRKEIEENNIGHWIKMGAAPNDDKKYIVFRFIQNGKALFTS